MVNWIAAHLGLLGFLVETGALAATVAKLITIDRPKAEREASVAERSQETQERKQVLATAQFFAEQVPALQEDNRALRGQLAEAQGQIAELRSQVTALAARYAEEQRQRDEQHRMELAERDGMISRLTLENAALRAGRAAIP